MSRRRELSVVVLMLLWALFVAIRNIYFEVYSWEWFILLVMGASVVFRAGMIQQSINTGVR